MHIFKDTLAAIKYINQSNLNHYDKICKRDNIIHKGICKVDNTIIIVDEYGLLD